MKELEKVDLEIVRWFLFASLFSPVLVSQHFFFPLVVPKTIFFQILIEIALFFFVVLISLKKEYLPKLDPLTQAILVFLGVYMLSAVLGENGFRSFFGNSERMLGVFNLAHFVAFFLMAKSVFSCKKDWVMFFRVFLAFGSVVAIYGIGQKFGAPFLYRSGFPRIDATIGNPAFFAAYMIFCIFFSVFLIGADKSKCRYFYFLSLLVSSLAAYLSETRAPIFGLLLGSLLAVLAFLLKGRLDFGAILDFIKNKNLKLALMAIALILLIVIAYNQNIFSGPMKRLSTISLEDPSIRTRMISAGVSWRGFLEHPLLGWGPENYNLVFDKHYDPRLHPSDEWLDHAHNIILDLLVSSGILGFLSCLFVILAAFRILFLLSKRSQEDLFAAVVFFALFLAYLFQNFFSFDTLVTYLPFFASLAFLAFLAQGDEKKEEAAGPKIPPAVLMLSFLVIACSVYFLNVRPALSAFYGMKAISTSPSRMQEVSNYFQKSLDFGLMGNPEIRLMMIDYSTRLIGTRGVSEKEKREFIELTKKESRKSLEEEPKNFRYYYYFANLMFVCRDLEFLSQLDALFDRAESFAPNRVTYWVRRYEIKKSLGKNKEALESLKKATTLNPSVRLNLELAHNYRQNGDTPSAVSMYRKILTGQISAQERVYVAIELAKSGEEKEAIEVIESVIDSDIRYQEGGVELIKRIKNGEFRER